MAGMIPRSILYSVIIDFNLFKGKPVYPINSHIAARVWKGSKMMEYYKKNNLFKFDHWIVCVHLGVHWAMMVGP